MRSGVDEYLFRPELEWEMKGEEDAVGEEDIAAPTEDTALPDYFAVPPEFDAALPLLPAEAEEETVETEEKSGAREALKKLFLIPVAATVATVSIVFASFGFDPLSLDIFASSSSSGYGAPSAVTPAIPEGADGVVHITYLPTGEEFVSSAVGSAGLEEGKAWVKKKGGDAEHMKLVGKKEVVISRTLSDDAVYVGDPDDPDNLVFISGGWVEKTRTDWYYEAQKPGESYSDSFPTLPNLEPDFAGKYAWSGMGSEEYLVVDGQYLAAGTVYTGGSSPVVPKNLPGAVYDKETNTLTLTNFHGSFIDANLMGNGFKVRLVGENSLGYIKMWGAMYGGSITFTGSGSIKLNENGAAPNGVGLQLECEDSPSCVMIDREATVEIFGDRAIVIHRTTLEKAIYTLRPITVTGGKPGAGEFVTYTVNVTDENGNVVFDENGDPLTQEKTVKDIAKDQGVDLYDYSVVGADGKPAKHVTFKPE